MRGCTLQDLSHSTITPTFLVMQLINFFMYMHTVELQVHVAGVVTPGKVNRRTNALTVRLGFLSCPLPGSGLHTYLISWTTLWAYIM